MQDNLLFHLCSVHKDIKTPVSPVLLSIKSSILCRKGKRLHQFDTVLLRMKKRWCMMMHHLKFINVGYGLFLNDSSGEGHLEEVQGNNVCA